MFCFTVNNGKCRILFEKTKDKAIAEPSCAPHWTFESLIENSTFTFP